MASLCPRSASITKAPASQRPARRRARGARAGVGAPSPRRQAAASTTAWRRIARGWAKHPFVRRWQPCCTPPASGQHKGLDGGVRGGGPGTLSPAGAATSATHEPRALLVAHAFQALAAQKAPGTVSLVGDSLAAKRQPAASRKGVEGEREGVGQAPFRPPAQRPAPAQSRCALLASPGPVQGQCKTTKPVQGQYSASTGAHRPPQS